LVEEMSITVD
jgi:hypothetical protein